MALPPFLQKKLGKNADGASASDDGKGDGSDSESASEVAPSKKKGDKMNPLKKWAAQG